MNPTGIWTRLCFNKVFMKKWASWTRPAFELGSSKSSSEPLHAGDVWSNLKDLNWSCVRLHHVVELEISDKHTLFFLFYFCFWVKGRGQFFLCVFITTCTQGRSRGHVLTLSRVTFWRGLSSKSRSVEDQGKGKERSNHFQIIIIIKLLFSLQPHVCHVSLNTLAFL